MLEHNIVFFLHFKGVWYSSTIDFVTIEVFTESVNLGGEGSIHGAFGKGLFFLFFW